jgi:DNA-binding IclR family transcriptional regulator
MKVDLNLMQLRRRRGTVLKLIRLGHENQLSRLHDGAVSDILLEMGQPMSIFQVITMLQDLAVLGYVQFDQAFDQDLGRYRLDNIMLTPVGLRFVDRRLPNEDVLFN